ncbi:MAG: hypothetical protein A2750_00140 [Candidatus Yanofskybacteria bacterium RIFCSPHIGHO2_01_FULL_45_42]|uniref:Uncharacterized protein n=3 Tax=Candidatus Yanofskyibacteriota TaxID=1752733 RepID=A0A1F8F5B3_9BACT|nr:MAG: hypothetical protein A2750_00140 [Candidatus Yanofskybacteria bacterium RIFCSPHIGHO2_01_FULL_45_42]OGN15865.1 MAG: hypothetical protein A3C81_02105 [Candidatus Yanofskybacteria bacterium RIFCSPHIGHO2_02_FULL_46_19]OGN27442.1 MAG: hypothetical protein A3B17_01560 [Candidatus Yanofskybacteria bacterium RIFCSPLOWO2_01_FULL_45_72]OGN32303.1 MAG: hypothetical protein A3J01_02470 [Candidatus Yanofskybacteria bacterium RIFCSPLOWO2_02_FULL_45_18]
MKNKEIPSKIESPENKQLKKLQNIENANSVVGSVLKGLRSSGNYSEEQIKEIEQTLRERLGIAKVYGN